MSRFHLFCAVAALLTGSLAAQQIVVFVGGAWSVTPGTSQTITTFVSPQVFCSLDTRVGTSLSGPAALTRADVTFQGFINGGPTVSGALPLQIEQASDIYLHGGGSTGTVTCNLTAEPDTAASVVQRTGSGYRAVANASVTVTCPAYSVSATCQALGVPPPAAPLVMTTPQVGTFMNGGQSSWFVAMDSRGDTNGSLSGPIATLKLVAACKAHGIVVLN